MCHMTRSQCAKVGDGAFQGSSACMDRWTGHAERVGGGASRGSNERMDRWTGHVEKVGGGAFRGSNAHKARWIGRVGNREVKGMWFRHGSRPAAKVEGGEGGWQVPSTIAQWRLTIQVRASSWFGMFTSIVLQRSWELRNSRLCNRWTRRATAQSHRLSVKVTPGSYPSLKTWRSQVHHTWQTQRPFWLARIQH
jgi:hypothetical protein